MFFQEGGFQMSFFNFIPQNFQFGSMPFMTTTSTYGFQSTFNQETQGSQFHDFGEFFNNLLFGGGMMQNSFDFSNPTRFEDLLNELYQRYQPPSRPPASEDAINGCPMIEITEMHVEKKESCSICMEEFKLQEKVMELPCQHMYHKDCVVTWLKTNNTCPVCRFELATTNGCEKESNENGQQSNENQDQFMEIVDESNGNETREVQVIDLDEILDSEYETWRQMSQNNNNPTPNEVVEFIEIDEDSEDNDN